MTVRRVLDQCLDRLAASPAWRVALDLAASGPDNLVIRNLHGGGVAAFAALLARVVQRPILLIAGSLERAEALTDGLAFFGAAPLIFPPFETLPFETTEPSLTIAAARHRALWRLTRPARPGEPPPLIVAPADALVHRVLPAEALREQTITIGWGERVDPEALARHLAAMGYTRQPLVESPGEFAIRGSIIDVYPPDAEWPWRIDLFGEEVEQIRRFDPATQRSLDRTEEHERIELLACACHEPLLERLARGLPAASLFDLLPPDALLLIDRPELIRQRWRRMDEVAQRHWDEIHRGSSATDSPIVRSGLRPDRWLLRGDELWDQIRARPRVSIAALAADADEAAEGDAGGAPDLGTLDFAQIPSKFDVYAGMIRERLRAGWRTAIVCDNNGQVMRLDELLREQELPATTLDGTAGLDGLPPDSAADWPVVALLTGDLHEGFYCPAARVWIVTDREIFGRYRRRHVYRKVHHGRPVANPSEIHRGDYVVHVEHGIALFEGIRRQMVDGRLTELLELTYQDGDKLLVPVEKLHCIQKYASGDGKPPALDKLGGKRWAARRRKSLEAVRKMAGELLALYARRAAGEGYAYGPDTVWQQEFEASFLYQETPDQLKAIADVKADMMRPRPMDRLVCGDVGYGKTEVAIRAAFKALVEGRQVAVLAPTTLLAQQHYRTFTERLAGYPFRVEMLSRFRTPAQQRATLEALASGAAHLVVGTHRLLSRDVRFRDLGLLIVDEEQRFGVAQKEKIKALRADVDVLTLTATPIPRTLYMALSGVRDLSVIATPPANRLPIKTRTIRFEREAIEEAILRELNRGGQVYFVHNRIESIHEVARELAAIVPQARLAVAHGKLDEEELERLMLDFIDGRYDILLSTTIIENGIDIPNVNTIIINRADTFGLAQLYQLRGRVGRDVRQAYAYLILPPGQAITPAAVKRLEALEEFTELGMGFAIAMRDMEIRGTGNLLGREQHGAITDVGFEMYCRLLEDAVRELRGLPPPEPLWPVEVKWPGEQFLPEEYIPVEAQRIRFYKDLAAARERAELELLVEELVDRYGALPPPAANLINAARVRVAAAPWRVDLIRPLPDGSPRLSAPVWPVELGAAIAACGAPAARAMFGRLQRSGRDLTLHLRARGEDAPSPDAVLAALADLFEALEPPPADAAAHGPTQCLDALSQGCATS